MSKESNGAVGVAFWLLGFALVAGIVVWLFVALTGMIALFPWGLIGLIPLTGMAILVFVVIRDRLRNKDDDYYSKNVDQ